MSTLKVINAIHPSGTINNIVNDSAGNVTVGNDLDVIGNIYAGNGLDVTGFITTSGSQRFTSAAYLYSYAGGTSGQVRSGLYLDGTNQLLGFYTATNERMRIDSTGNLSFNSGFGSVGKAYGCRAWVNFDGPTAAIRGSGNVTSVTKTSVANYIVNLTSALPDTNYVGSIICNRESYSQSGGITPSTTSSFSIGISANGLPYEHSIVQALIVR